MCKAPYQICVDSFLSTEKTILNIRVSCIVVRNRVFMSCIFWVCGARFQSRSLYRYKIQLPLFQRTVPQNNYVYQAKGLTREQIKLMKTTRRTMKNRGYAASCRVKRETQITELKVKKKKFPCLQNLSSPRFNILVAYLD